MHLKGENPFKVRAFEKAQIALESHPDWIERARSGGLTEIPGIGKSIASVLEEWIQNGTSSAYDALASDIPKGLVELSQVPGLGPKKAAVLIDKLGIESLGELEYACRENRLLAIPGFGVKLQAKVLEGIEFLKRTAGQARLGDVFEAAQRAGEILRKAAGAAARIAPAGEWGRRLETLSSVEFVAEDVFKGEARAQALKEIADRCSARFTLPVRVHAVAPERFGTESVRLTASPEHWQAIGAPSAAFTSEEQLYAAAGLPWIAPEFRETGAEVALARSGALAEVLPWDGVRGIFHNHTTRSDGGATLEQMVAAAEAAGYSYIGISDHSQSAVYAQGLKLPVLLEQESEIREVQKKHPGIRIFWGIESDILADGSLDYPDEVLARFDFVIASIHSRFQMDRVAMTDRLIAAVRNPRTTMLGHWSGRLLLGRKGYEFDAERVIEEAARAGVAIEINAHPDRLDIDWRYGETLRRTGALVSVNPDAHSVAGILDTHFGVGVARKALLSREQVLNARSVGEIEQWLALRKK